MKRVVSNVTCPFCGVVCDDLGIKVEDGTITEAKRGCVLGRYTFLKHHEGRATLRVNGEPATLERCIEEAVDILDQADFPLIYGLASTDCDAQRKAVELADLIGSTIDTTSSVCHSPSLQAVQHLGMSTSTVGEIKNRSRLLIFWGCNPAESHPRHFSRYSVTPVGRFVPEGRKGRYVVLVDVRKTPSSRAADLFIQVPPGHDYEVLTVLRALVNERPVDLEEVAGVKVEVLRGLAKRMKSVKYGTLFWGMGLTMSRGKHMNVMAMLSLARDLNRYTKFTAAPMRGHGNVVGAATVMSYSTGYPFGVNLSRGYPQYGPGEFTSVDVLARGEADAALIIAADGVGNFPRSAAEHLKKIPMIAIDPKESMTTKAARVVIPTAVIGIETAGTVYRMDGIPLPLTKVLDSDYPSDVEVLSRIIAGIRRRRNLPDQEPFHADAEDTQRASV
ncbi:MAG: formylmethanofuran dehydrogenase subunit B [Acidobacteriota bacterium]